MVGPVLLTVILEAIIRALGASHWMPPSRRTLADFRRVAVGDVRVYLDEEGKLSNVEEILPSEELNSSLSSIIKQARKEKIGEMYYSNFVFDDVKRLRKDRNNAPNRSLAETQGGLSSFTRVVAGETSAMRRFVEYNVRRARRNGLLPPTFSTLKTEHPDIYWLLPKEVVAAETAPKGKGTP